MVAKLCMHRISHSCINGKLWPGNNKAIIGEKLKVLSGDLQQV